MMLKHVSVEDFEDEVLKSDVKVLVDFYVLCYSSSFKFSN